MEIEYVDASTVNQNICRVCEETNSLNCIFDWESNEAVDEMFLMCTGIEIAENDGLPRYLCSPCLDDLRVAYTFLTRCKATDEKLRQLLVPCIDRFTTEYDAENSFKTENDSVISADTVLESLRSDGVSVEIFGSPTQQKMSDDESSRKKAVQSDGSDFNGPMHVCPKCSRSFYSAYTLKRHIAHVHDNIKAFKCLTCGKYFTQSSSLRTHEKLHSSQLYKCIECPRQFRTQKFLEAHMQSHLPVAQRKPIEESELDKNRRKFICSTCGKQFNNHMTHNVHMRRHTNERPYSCDHCDKQFRCKTMLKRHQLIHLNLKPYVCNRCNAAFRQNSHLRAHHMTHAKDH